MVACSATRISWRIPVPGTLFTAVPGHFKSGDEMKLGLHAGYWGLGITGDEQLDMAKEADKPRL